MPAKKPAVRRAPKAPKWMAEENHRHLALMLAAHRDMARTRAMQSALAAHAVSLDTDEAMIGHLHQALTDVHEMLGRVCALLSDLEQQQKGESA